MLTSSFDFLIRQLDLAWLGHDGNRPVADELLASSELDLYRSLTCPNNVSLFIADVRLPKPAQPA